MALGRLGLSLTVILALAVTINAHKILLYPFAMGVNSRLMNMEKIAGFLAENGHEVSMVINNLVAPSVHRDRRIRWVEYRIAEELNPRPMTDDVILEQANKLVNPLSMVYFFRDLMTPFCESLLQHRNILESLKAENYDLLFMDLSDECGRIIADYLDIPTILYSNYGFNHDADIFYPSPVSFVCPSEFWTFCRSDRLSFLDRLANMMTRFTMVYITNGIMHDSFNVLRKKYNINASLDSADSFKKYSVIANIDFAIDFPRPSMPHIIPISGLFRVPPKALPSELETVFQDSAPHGVILLSFGTKYTTFGEQKAAIFARVFARFPQTVLWRYEGKPPKDLGKNTKLVGWIPQNDMLAHPMMKLFITHCGVAGQFETAIHGVPVVALPRGMDQKMNAAKLVDRAGMGVLLNYQTLTEDALESAIREVLGDTNYKANAKRISEMMNSQPMPPRKMLEYWVNYVVRFDGAYHIVSQVAHELNLFQYLALDVIAVLIFVLVASLWLTCFCVRTFLKLMKKLRVLVYSSGTKSKTQ